VRTKLRGALLPQKRGYRVPSKAGDVVLFDMRLDHKASASTAGPPPVRKLALFVIAAKNDAHARSYLRYVQSRPDYLYLRGYRYSDALRSLASDTGVRLLEPELSS
jgi:hypothetical protein